MPSAWERLTLIKFNCGLSAFGRSEFEHVIGYFIDRLLWDCTSRPLNSFGLPKVLIIFLRQHRVGRCMFPFDIYCCDNCFSLLPARLFPGETVMVLFILFFRNLHYLKLWAWKNRVTANSPKKLESWTSQLCNMFSFG